MSTATAPESLTTMPAAYPVTFDEVVERLGGIALSRILARPAPGTATEADLIEAERRYNRHYELVDGMLVEKGMGYRESLLAGALIRILGQFIVDRNLGLISGADGSIRLFPGMVRVPDVAYASWNRFPGRKIPDAPIPSLAPDLVIEVLSESNTPGEMERKRNEYFASGVAAMWEVNPRSRSIIVHTNGQAPTVLDPGTTLEGGELLPGFSLKLGDLFSELDRHG